MGDPEIVSLLTARMCSSAHESQQYSTGIVRRLSRHRRKLSRFRFN